MTNPVVFDVEKLKKGRKDSPPVGHSYRYTPDLEWAVKVALATKRPLLLKGAPGSGKSTLADDAAWLLGWGAPEKHVITSRTQARDLLWEFDAVRRLSDVQSGQYPKDDPNRDRKYLKKGVLWRAFAPTAGQPGVVVLLDEIDKADPDIPNDLLVALDLRTFDCTDVDPIQSVTAPQDLQVLLIITTNEERDLPAAFLRRCIIFQIEPHTREELRAIALLHKPAAPDKHVEALLDVFLQLRDKATQDAVRKPSTAEFLDALKASLDLHIDPGSPRWEYVAHAAMWKHPKASLPAPGKKP